MPRLAVGKAYLQDTLGTIVPLGGCGERHTAAYESVANAERPLHSEFLDKARQCVEPSSASVAMSFEVRPDDRVWYRKFQGRSPAWS